MNIETFHKGLENRNSELLFEAATKDLIEQLVERGSLFHFHSIFPMGETGTRTVTDVIETPNVRVSTIENNYIVDDQLITITDLVWETLVNGKWKISKFWVLEIMGEAIHHVS